MATTYLEAVNEVLSEMNEVLLTSTNFASATNIQRHVKEAVNRAYFDVNNPEHKWQWLSVAAPQNDRVGNVYQETVAGQRWYLLNPNATDFNDDYGHVDWNNFELTTEGVAGETTPYDNERLMYIELEEWQDHFARAENIDKGDGQQYGTPYRVIASPDGRRFGLSPIPDKVYRIYYYAWDRPTKLVNHNDTVNLPDQYIPVLISRARYYGWQRKESSENAAIALQDYEKGLKGMRQQTVDSFPDAITDSRVRF